MPRRTCKNMGVLQPHSLKFKLDCSCKLIKKACFMQAFSKKTNIYLAEVPVPALKFNETV